MRGEGREGGREGGRESERERGRWREGEGHDNPETNVLDLLDGNMFFDSTCFQGERKGYWTARTVSTEVTALVPRKPRGCYDFLTIPPGYSNSFP